MLAVHQVHCPLDGRGHICAYNTHYKQCSAGAGGSPPPSRHSAASLRPLQQQCCSPSVQQRVPALPAAGGAFPSRPGIGGMPSGHCVQLRLWRSWLPRPLTTGRRIPCSAARRVSTGAWWQPRGRRPAFCRRRPPAPSLLHNKCSSDSASALPASEPSCCICICSKS